MNILHVVGARPNFIMGQDMVRLKNEIRNILDGRAKKGEVPPLWDGRAGERIADIIIKRWEAESRGCEDN